MSATGRPTSTDDELLRLFDESDDPVLTAAEIAEELEMTRQGVNYRLRQLDAEGAVARKKIGSRAVAWWRTDATR